jgi:hypothetical protein
MIPAFERALDHAATLPLSLLYTDKGLLKLPLMSTYIL